jgi:hypothetical protein
MSVLETKERLEKVAKLDAKVNTKEILTWISFAHFNWTLKVLEFKKYFAKSIKFLIHKA